MAHNLSKAESLRRKAANCRKLAEINPSLAEPMLRLAAEYEERAVESEIEQRAAGANQPAA